MRLTFRKDKNFILCNINKMSQYTYILLKNAGIKHTLYINFLI